MAIYELDGVAPRVAASAWVADTAQVIGNVVLGENASVWFGTVVRGDIEAITIGAGTNSQDASVLHADFGQPLVIGERVTVGHQVMLHGCTIGDETLIGIGAIVLNGARIGKNCLVGAGALVTEGKEFPDGSMIIGSPAKAVRELTPEQIEGLRQSAQHYIDNARRFQRGLRKIGLAGISAACHLIFPGTSCVSELHKFLFDGLPVRGMIVRLTDAWTDILARRAGNTTTGAYPAPVSELLGEMAAAGVLMQSNIKFNGALVLQVFGDGPVKLAVAEVQSDLSLRATATVNGDVPEGTPLSQMVNLGGGGRCAITLDPKDRHPGQQPYQGVVPLHGDRHEKLDKLSDVLQHYMLQSEQLDTILVLGANDQLAAGLLIQRMPLKGEGNLAAGLTHRENEDQIGHNEDYNRIAHLAASLTREELLTLDVDTILRRLFWEEKLLRFEPQQGASGPRFACTCSRERVSNMLRNLGVEEAESILAEREDIEVGCEFCGQQYRFDAVDAAQIFVAPAASQPPGPSGIQ